jgi:hypothetical protein
MNQILGTPFIKQRTGSFLDKSLTEYEIGHPILHGRRTLAAPAIVLNDGKLYPPNPSALLAEGPPRALPRRVKTPILAVDEPCKMDEEESARKQHFPEEEEAARRMAMEEKHQLREEEQRRKAEENARWKVIEENDTKFMKKNTAIDLKLKLNKCINGGHSKKKSNAVLQKESGTPRSKKRG